MSGFDFRQAHRVVRGEVEGGFSKATSCGANMRADFNWNEPVVPTIRGNLENEIASLRGSAPRKLESKTR
jgi:hypothetical protein